MSSLAKVYLLSEGEQRGRGLTMQFIPYTASALLNWLKSVPSSSTQSTTTSALSTTSTSPTSSPVVGVGVTARATPTKSTGSAAQRAPTTNSVSVSPPSSTPIPSSASALPNSAMAAPADCSTSQVTNPSAPNNSGAAQHPAGGLGGAAGSVAALVAADSDEDAPPAVLGDERRRDLAKSFQRDSSGKFNCAFCPYSTEHHGSMKNHQMTHTGEKPYECGTCGKKFIQKGNWRRHELRVHSAQTAPKGFTCPQCPETFPELHLMTAHHITTHLSPHGLLANGAANAAAQHFKKDMLSILDATLGGAKRKDKTCEVCLKQFASRHDMERHMRVHTRERPFVCPLCATGFTQKSSLKSHLYSVHNLSTPENM